jgi:hypothetical protein
MPGADGGEATGLEQRDLNLKVLGISLLTNL